MSSSNGSYKLLFYKKNKKLKKQEVSTSLDNDKVGIIIELQNLTDIQIWFK